MSTSSGESPRPPELTDIDLYCLKCGYNLRGLSGDPRRCPECGHLNPMGEVELPAKEIARELRRMESAPASCVGAVLSGLLWLAFAAWVLSADAWSLGVIVVLSIAVLTVIVVWWITAADSFRLSCMRHPGWRRALYDYHRHGLLLSLSVAALLAGPIAIYCWASVWSPWMQLGRIMRVALVSAGAGLILIHSAGRRSHRRLKAVIEPLQREVAVKMAHEHLRRRLRRVKVDLFFDYREGAEPTSKEQN